MKAMTVLTVMLSLLAAPAVAQMGKGSRGGDSKKAATKGPVIDEKAYKAALEKIPEPKEKYDPWGQMRPNPPAKKSN